MLRSVACRGVPALAALTACALPATAGAAAHLGQRTLRYGDRGHDVRVLQDFLTRDGIRTSVDGVFGLATRGHVRSFERRSHLRADGVLTPRDANVLRLVVASRAAQSPPTTPAPATGRARLNADGTATAPADAPEVVKEVIAAGNEIASTPYRYGGGHGRWQDSGYDCSGSVSYALHGGGLLRVSRDSSGFESYGVRGRGRWITVYGSAGHAYMTVAGLRFDTSGASAAGSRWQRSSRSADGYVVRHPRGF